MSLSSRSWSWRIEYLDVDIRDVGSIGASRSPSFSQAPQLMKPRVLVAATPRILQGIHGTTDVEERRPYVISDGKAWSAAFPSNRRPSRRGPSRCWHKKADATRQKKFPIDIYFDGCGGAPPCWMELCPGTLHATEFLAVRVQGPCTGLDM